MRAVKSSLAAGCGKARWLCAAMVAGALCLTGLTASAADTGKKAAAGRDKASASKSWVAEGLRFEDIESLLRMVPLEQREAILTNADAFKKFVKLEAANQSLLNAARANKFEKNALVQSLMRRGAERVLAETYLNQVIRNNLPKDFPTDKQVRAYYDENKAKFQTPERVHLWQIFLPLAKDAKKSEVVAVRKQADRLVRELRRHKLDFSTAAEQYSKNQPSRLNGGYMGLTALADLVPAVRSKVVAMKANDISDPIRTDDGYHIIKRGGTVVAQSLSFDEIRPEVKKLLVRDVVAKIRKAAVKKVQETYPVTVNKAELDKWRSRLRKEVPSAIGKTDAAARESKGKR
jgi:peptidylprolyl isomerase